MNLRLQDNSEENRNEKQKRKNNNIEMKKVITIKIEVDMTHPAREEWMKLKDFTDTEIDEVLDHIRDFTRPYKKESGKSPSKASTYSVNIQHIKK